MVTVVPRERQRAETDLKDVEGEEWDRLRVARVETARVSPFRGLREGEVLRRSR